MTKAETALQGPEIPKKRLVARIYRPQGEGSQTSTHFEYDAQGRKLRETFGDRQGIKIKESEYKYDDKGNVVEVLSTTFDVSGKIVSKHTELIEYDDQNREIHNSMINSNGATYFESKNEYDNHGRLAKTESYSINSEGGVEPPTATEHIYDEAINKETVVTKDRFGIVSRTIEIQTDEQGREISVSKNSNGEITAISEREYDSQGEPIKDVTKDAKGEVVSTMEWENRYE